MANREDMEIFLWDGIEREVPYGCIEKVRSIVLPFLEGLSNAELREEYECRDGPD